MSWLRTAQLVASHGRTFDFIIVVPGVQLQPVILLSTRLRTKQLDMHMDAQALVKMRSTALSLCALVQQHVLWQAAHVESHMQGDGMHLCSEQGCQLGSPDGA